MSSPRDYPDEMTTDLPIDDRTAENLLRGRRAAVDPADHPLIDALGAIREDATTTPQPDAALLDVFAHGIDDLAQHSGTEDRGRRPAGTRRRGRIRGLIRPAAARVAALGLMTKAALAATAVAAAALGGAGAAGILPGQTDGPPPAQDPSTNAPETERSQDPTGTRTDRPVPLPPQQEQETRQEPTPRQLPDTGERPSNQPADGTAGEDALGRLPEQLRDPAQPAPDPDPSATIDDPAGQVTDGVGDGPTDALDDPTDLLDGPAGEVEETTGDVEERAEDTDETVDETIDDAEETIEGTTGSLDTSGMIETEQHEQDDATESDDDRGPLSLP